MAPRLRLLHLCFCLLRKYAMSTPPARLQLCVSVVWCRTGSVHWVYQNSFTAKQLPAAEQQGCVLISGTKLRSKCVVKQKNMWAKRGWKLPSTAGLSDNLLWIIIGSSHSHFNH